MKSCGAEQAGGGGQKDRGIKGVVIFSSVCMCMYGVLNACVRPQFKLESDHWIRGSCAPGVSQQLQCLYIVWVCKSACDTVWN